MIPLVTEQPACGSRVGTWAGYMRHKRSRQQPCPACLAACVERSEARRRAEGIEPRPEAQCGTRAGYRRHPKGTACDPCRAAEAAYQQKRRAARKKAKQETQHHG